MFFKVSACEADYGEWIRSMNSLLHRRPELSMEEFQTTEKIKEILESLGIQIIDISAKVGVVGCLDCGEGPSVGLRADMDALPQEELADREDRSEVCGKMHGCGHDVHMTCLLGAARILSGKREELHGKIYFIFQPAEETLQGAAYLIRECGLWEKIRLDAIFGLHNYPEFPVGSVGVKKGQLMSFKDEFSIRFVGKTGHTSKPHQNIDPIVAVSAFIQSVQTIVSRNVNPLEPAVVSIGQVHAGTPANLVIEDALVTGNIRTLSSEVRDRVLERLKTIAEGIAQAYECRLEYDCFNIVPNVFNGEKMYPIAKEAAARTVGEEHVLEPPVNLASEDFSLYGQKVPAFFYFLGSGSKEHQSYTWHDRRFYPDVDTAVYGAVLMANSVLTAVDYSAYLHTYQAYRVPKDDQDRRTYCQQTVLVQL